MLRIQFEQASDEVLLHLDTAARRRLASVLGEWLGAYAGVQPAVPNRENFDVVVELRRVLLTPDERPHLAGDARV